MPWGGIPEVAVIQFLHQYISPKRYTVQDSSRVSGDEPPPGTVPAVADMPGKWKVFVLNLDRSTDRMAHMDAMLASIGLPYERISAVDGIQLADRDIKANYNSLLYGVLFGRQLSRGELGCALSHRLAYKAILEQGLDWAIVLEDDVVVEPTLPALLGQILDASGRYDVIQLYYAENKVHPKRTIARLAGLDLIAFTGPHASAVAYAVKASGARKLLKARRVFMMADKFSWMSALFGVAFCACEPVTARPHAELNSRSNIDQTNTMHGSRVRYGKSTLWKIFARPALVALREALANRVR